jgi:hypothetical protein
MAGFAIGGRTMRTLRWIAGLYAALVVVTFGAVVYLGIERTPADMGPWAKFQITKRMKLSETPLVDDCVAAGGKQDDCMARVKLRNCVEQGGERVDCLARVLGLQLPPPKD